MIETAVGARAEEIANSGRDRDLRIHALVLCAARRRPRHHVGLMFLVVRRALSHVIEVRIRRAGKLDNVTVSAV